MSLTIEYLKISELERYTRNARMHSDEQTAQIIASIEEYGFTNPVLVDEHGTLIAGHGRLAAAEQMGMKEVPAIRLAHLTESQSKALRIADNQLALNSTWDIDLLTAELEELKAEDVNLEVLGFDKDYLNGLLSNDDEFEDGHDDDAQPADDDSAADVGVVIGPYRLSVARKHWDRWETRLRSEVGFETKDIEREIARRLGFE